MDCKEEQSENLITLNDKPYKLLDVDAVSEAIDWMENTTWANSYGDKRDGYKMIETIIQALQSRAGEEGEGELLNDIKGHIYPENIDDYLMGIRCGIEDRDIYDRYEAAEYGYEQALEYALSCIPDDVNLPHPSRADAVDVEKLMQEHADKVPYCTIDSFCNAVEYLHEQGYYLTKKPEDGMVNEWQPIESAPRSSPLIRRTVDKDGNKVVIIAEWFYEILTADTEGHNQE